MCVIYLFQSYASTPYAAFKNLSPAVHFLTTAYTKYMYKVHVKTSREEPSYLGNSMKYLYNFSSSLFQIVFKISVLKNFAIIAGKHLYWSLFLINLQVFSCEHCKVFKNSLFHGTNLVAASSV